MEVWGFTVRGFILTVSFLYSADGGGASTEAGAGAANKSFASTIVSGLSSFAFSTNWVAPSFYVLLAYPPTAAVTSTMKM